RPGGESGEHLTADQSGGAGSQRDAHDEDVRVRGEPGQVRQGGYAVAGGAGGPGDPGAEGREPLLDPLPDAARANQQDPLAVQAVGAQVMPLAPGLLQREDRNVLQAGKDDADR